MLRFTSEFGMGSGGSTALWPPSEKDGEGLYIYCGAEMLGILSQLDEQHHQMAPMDGHLGVICSSLTSH